MAALASMVSAESSDCSNECPLLTNLNSVYVRSMEQVFSIVLRPEFKLNY